MDTQLTIEQPQLLTPTSAERKAAIGLVLMLWPNIQSDRTFYAVYILKNDERALDVCTRLMKQQRENPNYEGVYFCNGNRVIGAFPLPAGLTQEQEGKLVANITRDYNLVAVQEGIAKTPLK